MRVPGFLAAVVMAGLAASAWAGDGTASGGHGMGRSISVRGQGVVSARPDFTELHAGVTSQAPSAKAALLAHNKILADLLAALESFGLAERDVQSQQVDLRAIYPSRGQQDVQPAPSAFRATGNVRIRLRAVDRLGELLDRLAAVGVNNLSGLHFAIADPAPLLDTARKRAIQDARRRAQLYATEAGVQLGPVLRIEESAAGAPVPQMRALSSVNAGSPIAPGRTEIGVTLRVIFAIK